MKLSKLSKALRKSWAIVQNFRDRDSVSGEKICRSQQLTRIGSDYGGWHVPLDCIPDAAIAYCAGCGEDITFDLGLIAAKGCKIFGFDPTPRAMEFVSALTKDNENYTFEAIGLWDSKSELKFYQPADSAHVSHSLLNLQKTNSYITVPVCSITDLMEKYNHTAIDLLKLDIEGAEYRVLASLLASHVRPNIICVEFDEYANPLDSEYSERIKSSIKALTSNGYQMIHSELNGNYTFLQQSANEASNR